MQDADLIREIETAARSSALLSPHEAVRFSRLSGGVSCDVFLLERDGGPALVAKQTLPKLRVEAEWRAPVERIEAEVAWLRLVEQLDARLVPRVMAEDRRRHLFFMEYLPSDRFPVWKHQLSEGSVDLGFAAKVGRHLARIHAHTANTPGIASCFDNQPQFRALRLDPYLLTAAQRNPDVARDLESLIRSVEDARIALMQGDISPKNILVGPDAPVFLDAETACYGDPAFDLAFCLNHLLLKCVWRPRHITAFIDAFGALASAYSNGVTWEEWPALDVRAAKLLAGLLLARVDGKSPVEYLTDPRDKAFVRENATRLLKSPLQTTAEIALAWREAANRYFADSGTR